MNNLKICIFLPSIGYGGAEINLKRVGEYLSKIGVKVVFVIAKTVEIEQPACNKENLEYIFLESKKTIFSINKLRHTINKIKPNIILTTLPTSNFLVVFLSYLKLINCKVVIREANSNFLKWNGSLKNYLKKIFALFTFNNSDGIIFISEELKYNVKKFIKNKNTTVIYNPVFINDFYLNSKVEINEFHKTKELWITTSRLEYQKGLDIFFDIIPNLLEERDFEVLSIGGGSLFEEYKEKYSSLPITFLGNVDNPLKYLYIADVFVFPSRWEGLGNSLIEAQILGKNIISSNCPSGPKEIIRLFDNGVVFKSENKDSLISTAKNIEIKDEVIVDIDLIKMFSVEHVSMKYLNYIKSII